MHVGYFCCLLGVYGIGPILTLLSAPQNTLSLKWSLWSLLGRGRVGCGGIGGEKGCVWYLGCRWVSGLKLSGWSLMFSWWGDIEGKGVYC